MGVQNPPSAVLFGANNLANNLQNGMLLTPGEMITYNGPKNYLAYNNFENNATTGWSLGTVGTLTNGLPTGSPTFGSGASGNLTLSVASSGQLAGTYSLSLASSAATTQGNMLASQAYAIDIADQAKVLSWRFNYEPSVNPTNGNWSGTSSNTFAVAVWDVTNSAWLTSAGNFNLVQSTGVGVCTGTCQTNSTTASIRFVIYCANASSGAITMLYDSFFLGPQTSPMGPAMSDPISFTPTGSWTTNTTYYGFYQRIGKLARIQYVMTLIGAPNAATNLTLNMPPGLVIDTTALPNGSANQASMAFGNMLRSGVLQLQIGVNWSSTTSFAVVPFGTTAGTNPQNVGQGSALSTTNPYAWGSGDYLNLVVEVPIVGWSSNTVSSADTDTRVIECYLSGSSSQAVASATPVTVTGWTAVTDNAGGWNSGSQFYSVPVSGYYEIEWNNYFTSVAVGGSTGTIQSRILINGSSSYNDFTSGGGTAAQTRGGRIKAVAKLNAGDTIALQVYQDTGTSLTLFGSGMNASIVRVSGPAVVQATESVNGSYKDTSGTAISTIATYTYATKIRDSHNAYSGGTLTIPVSGQYRFSASIASAALTLSTTNSFGILILRNGSTINEEATPGSGGASVNYYVGTTVSYPCNAGDTITVQVFSNTATTANTTAGNTFCWERVGN